MPRPLACLQRGSSASSHIRICCVFLIIGVRTGRLVNARPASPLCISFDLEGPIARSRPSPSWVDCITSIGVPHDGLYFCALQRQIPRILSREPPQGSNSSQHARSPTAASFRCKRSALEELDRIRGFSRTQAPFRFTVCDNAAGETCPVWPGQPMTAHWGVPDPAETEGSPAEIALAFKDTYRMLNQRIGIFTSLPIRSLDRLTPPPLRYPPSTASSQLGEPWCAYRS